MKTFRQTLSFFYFALLLSANAWAQFASGSLSGTVIDANGAALAAPKVKATNVNTGRSYDSSTSSAGLYSFPNLIVGTYTLAVEQNGFTKQTGF
jgi:hypothetical protein